MNRMPPFPVFASYAQLDRDKYLERFIDEFRRQLQVLTGKPDASAIAFFDRDGVRAGDRWSETIINAVNAADVLLCLMSPTYFTREWCGRELEAFLRRESRLTATANSRFIFPIWWQVPVAPRPLPRRLSPYHHRDANFPPAYESAGIRGLARQRRWIQFQRIADRLAELVAQTLAQPQRLPPGEAVADILDIANAFDEQQPYDVRMLALTTGGDAWLPSAADSNIADAASETARRLLIFIRKVETGPMLGAQLQRAQAEQQVVLLVVDAAIPLDGVIQTINGLHLPNLAVLLVDAKTPAVGGDVWLSQLPDGAVHGAKARGLMRVANAGEMSAQMERLVDEARRRLMADAPAARVEDPRLAQKALAQGISIDIQPNLAGPGAEN